MDKEEIEKATQFLDVLDIYGLMYTAYGREKYIIENVFKPIHHLETKNKELSKCQYTLMQSRRKWKARYYKERRKVKKLEAKIDVVNWQEKSAIEILDEKYVPKEKLKELEEREQKVKDKLKKDKQTIETTYSQINGNYFMAQYRLDLIEEILNLYKEKKNK